ncbi:NAD(P)H-binding protein [Andreprevotia chitinilytica]|uniref:NAD(P)H-binding protein n=1 Tax=Andreprevotia chitinilytica TaxID=396808 RepID=UPI00054D7C1C|nr:NAD(P)H-binding protein [Andreprevotia chitinilytica]
MRILILGADGFLGRHISAALAAAGHTIVEAVRHPVHANQIGIDFMRDHNAAVWLPRLANINVVMNCVGLFRETAHASFDAIHLDAPRALYAACRQAGVRRVLLISALGAASDAPTRYWRSKAAGEAVLQESGVAWTIVRPSLVYGDDGASSRLFATLARLPLLALPAECGDVQPIHVDDFAAGVVALLSDASAENRSFDATGPQALPFTHYLAALAGREQLPCLRMPNVLCHGAAWLAERWPAALLTRDSLTMLAVGNVGSGADFAARIGKPLRTPADFVGLLMRLQTRQAFARGWLRGGLAFVWFATAIVSLWVYPVAASHQLLATCHLPPLLFEPARIGAALLDATFGILTLLRPGKRLWQAQLALIACYTVIVAICLPEFVIHPFGPLTKNAGLLAALLALITLEEK